LQSPFARTGFFYLKIENLTLKCIVRHMREHLLTFELDKNNEQIFVHGDPSGLRFLATVLTGLAERAESGQVNHDHLMTEEWGGTELSPIPQGAGTKMIHHVKIYGLPQKDLKNV
jgi:hypothetical protein